MRKIHRLIVGLLAAATTAGTAGTAAAAPDSARLVGTVIAHQCRDLGITIDLTPAQIRRAAALLPAGFTLTDAPTLLVETSECERGTLNGKAIGSFKLSEAALSVRPPKDITSNRMTELVAENIYMLSQLDSNAVLSQYKSDVGYPAEVTRITLGNNVSATPNVVTATAGGTIAPSRSSATVSPTLLPGSVSVPNPGLIYKLWTKNSAGQYVVTTNNNFAIATPALGYGQVVVDKGTPLYHLLGAPSASGIAFTGAAQRFVNDTYVFGK